MPKLDESQLSVSGQQLITPAGSIEEVLHQFQLYQQLKTNLATDEDFQVIGGKKHPKKSFVRKVQRFFNLSCEILRDEPLKDGDQIIAWIATARANHLPTGAYQDADGSCSFEEKVEGQRTVHNIRAHAITRAKNRAVLDLVGFGDVSAEEIADTEKRVYTDQDGTITKNQARRMFALAKGDTDLVKSVLKDHGYSRSEDVKKIDYDTICFTIEEQANKKQTE